MGCNIPRPSKRPPTPPISDQPYGSKTNEAVLKAFDQFHEVAHDLTYHDTDLDQTIKERRTNCPNCCAYHTDEGVYLQEETRLQYRAILWENIHEWLEELKELRKKQRPHGNWEYLKEHITEMRDADGELNQKQTCQFILNLMGVIEGEGDEK